MSKIDDLLKANYNRDRKHLQKLARSHQNIQRLAVEIKGISQDEVAYLAEKLIDETQRMDEIVLGMLLQHRKSS